MNQPLIDKALTARPVPAFFPRRLRKAVHGKRIRVHLHAAMRERMQVPEDISVSQYAERHRHVTAIDAHPGRWRNDVVPHTVKAMDFISSRSVRQLWLCWPERAGKTQVILNGAMWQIDRGVDSGSIFWLMPTENEVKKALGERIIEVFKASPRTKRLLSDYADDTTRSIIRFRHGPRLFPAWSNSAASVSSFFGRLNIADEIDKFDTSGVGKETDILTLFFKRGRDRADSKFLFASTPAEGYIWKGANGCQQVWRFKSRCVHCGELIEMDSDHVVIPVDATAEQCAHGLVPLSYACNSCGAEWSETDRAEAYHLGEWVCIKGENEKEPVSVGLLLAAYNLPNIPITEIAEKIVKAKNGTETEKKALANGYDVKDYKEDRVARKEDHILRLIDPSMPRGIVPAGVNSLVIIADTQKIGFYYEIVAFGWGRDMENWIIDHGYVEQFDHLNKLADRDWFDAEGKKHLCRAGFIDSGGGTDPNHPKHSRTREVYDFCIDNPFWSPLKGKQRQSSLYSWTRLDYFPGKDGQRVTIPGGLLLYTLDTTQYKNMLERKLLIDSGNPGACHLHAGLTLEELESWTGPHSAQEEGRLRWMEYAKQMCSEYKNEYGKWQCLTGRANHHWDLGVYRYVAADILMIGDEKPDETEEQHEEQPQKPGNTKRSRRW